jgi:hypothetical protein
LSSVFYLFTFFPNCGRSLQALDEAYMRVKTNGDDVETDTTLASMNSLSGVGGGNTFPEQLVSAGMVGQCSALETNNQPTCGSFLRTSAPTAAPTTAAPTTAAPTNAVPTTKAPTTAAPTGKHSCPLPPTLSTLIPPRRIYCHT